MFPKVCAAAFVLIAATISTAQVRNITLDDARHIALDNNVSVIQAMNNIDAAQSSVTAAYGSYLPTLAASGGWSRYQSDRPATSSFAIGGIVVPGTSGFSVDNDFRANLGVNWLLFDGLSREGSFNQASSNAISTELVSNRTRQSIVFQVEQSYLNILRTERLVSVAEENLKRDQRQLERITESNKVGALSLADVYRQQSQVAADEFALINAKNDYDKSKADVVSLIGLDVSLEYTFTDSALIGRITKQMDEVMRGEEFDFPGLSREALEKRPDYLSARELLSSSESGIDVARGSYFPRVTASAGYGIQSNDLSTISENRTLSWGVNFQWSLFDGFSTNQAVQSAAVQKRNAEVGLVQAERDIRVEIKKALLDIDAARKQVDVTEKGLKSATEDLRIQQERYNLGAGTLLDLLTASAGFVNAEAAKINAIYSYIVSRLNLEYVVGRTAYGS